MTDEQRAREVCRLSLIAQGGCSADAECLHCRRALDAYASAVEARVRRELAERVRERFTAHIKGEGDLAADSAYRFVLRLLGETER